MSSHYQPRVTPWMVDETDYRKMTSSGERIDFLLRYAILAPSGHNRQPWRFEREGETLRVYADYGKSLPNVDPGDRELIMSTGTALFNLRVASAYFGYSTAVRHERSNRSDLLATVEFSRDGAVEHALAALFPAILTRRTNRSRFHDRALSAEHVSEIAKLDQGEPGVKLVSGPDALAAVGKLVRDADRIQMSSTAVRRELASLVHPDDTDAADGFAVQDLTSWGGCWHVRSLNLGGVQGRKDFHRVYRCGALAVIYSEDVQDSLLAAGELTERLLLTATRLGLQYSFLNQPIQVRRLRPRLREMLGLQGWPQLLIRLGYGQPVARPMPRRPLQIRVTTGEGS